MKSTNPDIYFTQTLLHWHTHTNARVMPWKGEKNPYFIWLSEIILQQTRVQQGLAYYQKFIEHYPDVHALAKAEPADVFKLWEGLGYYNRCRNLLFTANYISSQLDGVFPKDHESILALKGVGHYTAAAIASFAYDLPYAVLDGNVYRVLARYFGINTSIDTREGKLLFSAKAQLLLPHQQPAVYNQAIMDFGATICLPKNPLCSICPLHKKCTAFLQNRVGLLPVKTKKIIRKTRYFFYTVITSNNFVLVRKRTGNDIWQNLHEFYLEEKDEPNTDGIFTSQKILEFYQGKLQEQHQPVQYQQTLTHQNIQGSFTRVEVKNKILIAGYEWIKKGEVAGLGFPILSRKYLQDYPLI